MNLELVTGEQVCTDDLNQIEQRIPEMFQEMQDKNPKEFRALMKMTFLSECHLLCRSKNIIIKSIRMIVPALLYMEYVFFKSLAKKI